MNAQSGNLGWGPTESESASPSGTSRESSLEPRLFLVEQQLRTLPPTSPEFPARALENRVLVLAPAGVDGLLIGRELTLAGIKVKVCESLDELCSRMLDGVGAAIIAEEALTPTAI